jgi:hypothetical protein
MRLVQHVVRRITLAVASLALLAGMVVTGVALLPSTAMAAPAGATTTSTASFVSDGNRCMHDRNDWRCHQNNEHHNNRHHHNEHRNNEHRR